MRLIPLRTVTVRNGIIKMHYVLSASYLRLIFSIWLLTPAASICALPPTAPWKHCPSPSRPSDGILLLNLYCSLPNPRPQAAIQPSHRTSGTKPSHTPLSVKIRFQSLFSQTSALSLHSRHPPLGPRVRITQLDS